jgi:hypothetical protein
VKHRDRGTEAGLLNERALSFSHVVLWLLTGRVDGSLETGERISVTFVSEE